MSRARFAGKSVFITGAASGIGRASARLFAAEGAKLTLVDQNAEGGAALAAELGADKAVFVAANVGVWGDVEAAVAKAVKTYGKLDVLFNNAGIAASGATVDVDPESWERVIAVDLNSVFYACRAAIPHMTKPGGSIINTASISGLGGDHRMAAYNAAKGGVVNYTRSLAVDYGREGLRVNAICPGVTETAMTEGLKNNNSRHSRWLEAIPMNRTAQPEEMAKVVAFLASDDASYVNGVILPVDGGVTAAVGSPRQSV